MESFVCLPAPPALCPSTPPSSTGGLELLLNPSPSAPHCRHLPDLMAVIQLYWSQNGDPKLILSILKLLSELSAILKEDFRPYLGQLVPRFIGLLAEAERSGVYSVVSPVLETLESLGPVVEDYLHLLLPALMRVVNPALGGASSDVARETLLYLRRLLPNMQLSSYAAAVIHPLIRVLDGPAESLRVEALDTLSFLAPALGPEFALFVPSIRKAMVKNGVRSARFDSVASHVTGAVAPCLSEASDWDTDNYWVTELEQAAARMQRRPTAEAAAAAAAAEAAQPQTCAMNEVALRRAWMSSERSTKEDWIEWMRNFSVELLKESPSPALRACHTLAQIQPQMARDLFPAGFVSCWNVLPEQLQEQLVRSLEVSGVPESGFSWYFIGRDFEILKEPLLGKKAMDGLVRMVFASPSTLTNGASGAGGAGLPDHPIRDRHCPSQPCRVHGARREGASTGPPHPGRTGRKVPRVCQGAALQGDRVRDQPAHRRRAPHLHLQPLADAGRGSWDPRLCAAAPGHGAQGDPP